MAEETCDWTGISGRQYTFRVFGLGSRIAEEAKGNYIYAKLDPDNRWRPIYLGHGDLTLRCTHSAHHMDCIKRMGATHVHLRPTPGGEATRKAITRDLLARYSQAYAPIGCTSLPGDTREDDRGARPHTDDQRGSAPLRERKIDGQD